MGNDKFEMEIINLIKKNKLIITDFTYECYDKDLNAFKRVVIERVQRVENEIE